MAEKILRPADLYTLGQHLPERPEPTPIVTVPVDFVDRYNRMTAAEAKERYISDPAFAALVDEIDRRRSK
jgi:hypothetical protein